VTNFAFLKAVGWPTIHTDCAHAESHATSDPRAACIYARRTVEHLAGHLYDVLALAPAYRNNLSARINDDAFVAGAGPGM
jgi:type I restriction enzyme R subunit